jgi:hypothetical protein
MASHKSAGGHALKPLSLRGIFSCEYTRLGTWEKLPIPQTYVPKRDSVAFTAVSKRKLLR